MVRCFFPSRYRLFSLLVCLVGIFLSALPRAGAAAQTPADAGIRETRLPDGLIVLTKEVHAAPVVCTYVWYRVGSRNEEPPLTGISHQLEHMMFKGTKKAFPNPGYIDLLVGRYGGENNAQTDTDTTSYYLLLPSDQLDLALRIEADRMTQAAIDPNQLTAEKRVVLSELEGDENDNAFFLYESTRAAAYQYHPYHYPVIGTKFDVLNFTRPEVYGYYQEHYAPNNAVLVLVGDFNTDQVLARVRQLWSGVQAHTISRHPIDPEPPQRGERRVVVSRAGANAYLEMMYHIPAATSPDLPALTVLATALSNGRSSRLYRALVETQLATDVGASANLGVDPEVFDISASARAGVMPDAIEKPLLAEIARVQNQPLSDQDLQKAKNQTRADFVFGQDSVEEQAAQIGYFECKTGDWHNLVNYVSRINAVTAADVQRVARTYLTADNRTIGYFIPNGQAPPPGSDTGASRTTHYKGKGKREKGKESTSNIVPPAGRLAEGLPDGPFTARPENASEAQSRVPPFPANAVRELGRGAGGVGNNVQERRLANGLDVIVQENHANPMIVVTGCVRAGSVDDPQGKYGLANIVADMLLRGTATRTSQQIAEATDFVGAQIGTQAARERTDFSAQMLTANFPDILGLLADVLRNPSFPADELEKERGEVLTALQQEAQDTGIVSTRRLFALLYPPTNPYEHPADGAPEDVHGITRDDVVNFYRRAYRPDRTTMIIVGDITPEAAFTAVEKAFGDWKGQGEAAPAYVPPPVNPAPAVPPVMVTLPDKSQDDIAMGQIGLSRKDPDYEAADIMNLILGGDEFVGRVGKRVRDTEGLGYYAYTVFAPGLEAGPWVFRAGANPSNVSHAIASARDEVNKMVAGGVTEAELAWAKDHAIGARRLSLATDAGIAAELENDAFYGLGLDYAQRYPQIVRALTKAQVDAAARKYLHPAALDTVVAGPPVPGLTASK